MNTFTINLGWGAWHHLRPNTPIPLYLNLLFSIQKLPAASSINRETVRIADDSRKTLPRSLEKHATRKQFQRTANPLKQFGELLAQGVLLQRGSWLNSVPSE